MAFGTDAVDHFGTAAMLTAPNVLTLISSTGSKSESRADALNEDGDPVASAYYGAGTVRAASSTFALTGGELLTTLLQLGELVAGKCVTSIEISTSNDGWPQVVVSGSTGLETMFEHDDGNAFNLPEYTISARKQAQQMGIAPSVTCKLTGSSLSANVELAQQEGAGGDPVAHGVSGGTFDISAELVAVTGPCDWTITTHTETSSSSDEGQASWGTASVTASGTIQRADLPE